MHHRVCSFYLTSPSIFFSKSEHNAKEKTTKKNLCGGCSLQLKTKENPIFYCNSVLLLNKRWCVKSPSCAQSVMLFATCYTPSSSVHLLEKFFFQSIAAKAYTSKLLQCCWTVASWAALWNLSKLLHIFFLAASMLQLWAGPAPLKIIPNAAVGCVFLLCVGVASVKMPLGCTMLDEIKINGLLLPINWRVN